MTITPSVVALFAIALALWVIALWGTNIVG
jgi:hypothetical protein